MSSEENQDLAPGVEVITATLSDKFQQKMADAYAKSLEELTPLSEYTLQVDGEPVKFKRRKILTKERKELEVLRARLATQARRNSEQSVETEDKLYKKSAEFYLIDPNTNKGMTTEQFELIPFEDLKQVLDACAYRTERVIPPLED